MPPRSALGPAPALVVLVLALATGCRSTPAGRTESAREAGAAAGPGDALSGCTIQRSGSMATATCGPIVATQFDAPYGSPAAASRGVLERFAAQFPAERARPVYGPVTVAGRQWPGVRVPSPKGGEGAIGIMAAVEAAPGFTRLVSCAAHEPAAAPRCDALLAYLAAHRISPAPAPAPTPSH